MIFYFSGTGNTRWVAQQIAEAIGEELVSIPDAIRQGQYSYTLQTDERLGFCFPTHGWQPPRIVRDFIAQMQVQNSHFCWALTTCGDNMGECMTILNKDLRPKGLEAETLFSVIMPESYVCLPFMYTDTEEKETWKLENAQHQLSHIIPIIRDRKRGIAELEKGATPRLYSYVLGAYFNKRMITDRKFTVDTEVCIKCGKCMKVCPADNIAGTPPEWLHNGRCTCCLACYHHCPTHAINYGDITRKRGQYYFNKREGQR
jgi:Pyruvate/2-oxoacid:ferredoxin oxidoreductase delta subunit